MQSTEAVTSVQYLFHERGGRRRGGGVKYSSSKLSGKLQRLAVVVLQIQGLKLSSRDETSSYRLSINRISGRN